MLRQSLVRTIERLTAEHELYQQTELSGGHDGQWSTWYADRLLADGVMSEAGIQLTTQQLADLLEREFARFAAGSESSWAEHLADRILS